MSNFSKIVITILLVLSFFFVKEKWGNDISNFLSSISSLSKIEFKLPEFVKNETKQKGEVVKKPTEVLTTKDSNQEKTMVDVYFLALDANDNGIYKKVQREIPVGANKLEYAMKELLKGPNIVEKSTGAYSEVPKTTKLLSVKQTGNKVIIDFSSDFQYGGGTDSVYSRMMQLIKTFQITAEKS